MKPFLTLILLLLATAWPVLAQDDGGALAKVKERELEDVRERISDLKESMDQSAASRDRVTAELQIAEVEISEQRIRLRELERERDYSARRKAGGMVAIEPSDAVALINNDRLCARRDY